MKLVEKLFGWGIGVFVLLCAACTQLDFTEKHIKVNVHVCGFKSSFDEYQEKISGINVLLFDASDGKLLKEHSAYYTLEQLRSMSLPADGVYRLYFFANVPDLSGSFPAMESELENFGYCMDSYEDFALYGLPMSYCQQIDAGNEEILNIWFQRLVTRLELSFDRSSLSPLHQKGTFIKSLHVGNAALDVYPFAAGGSKATRATSGKQQADNALDADVDILNAGGTIFLYTLTNMQGELLPPDTKQNEKTPEHLAQTGCSARTELLTYVEAHCALNCDDWTGGDVVLRHYLGGDSPDNYNCSFNVLPGKTRRVCLTLTEDDPLLQPWRFEAAGGMNYKKFSFGQEDVGIMQNFGADLEVCAPFNFEIIGSSMYYSAKIIESTYDSGQELWKKVIRLETDTPLSGLLPEGESASPASEKLTLRSLTRSRRDTCVNVNIYHSVFPLALRVDQNDVLQLDGENPLQLSFNCIFELSDISGNVIKQGSSTICPPASIADLKSSLGQNVILSVLLQPAWENNSGFFMGSGNAAMFGPGGNYSPGRLDATSAIMFATYTDIYPKTLGFSSNVDYHLDLSYTTDSYDNAPKIFFVPSTTAGDTRLLATEGFSFGKPDYRFKIGNFTPPRSTGHNNCDNYVLSDFEQCPFYIANGGMMATHIDLYTHSWSFSSKLEEIKVKFLRPGRDLRENASETEREAELILRINGAGNNAVWIDQASYNYNGIHLIVNGCTCWPGGAY